MLFTEAKISATFHELTKIRLLLLKDEEDIIERGLIGALWDNNVKELREKATLLVLRHFLQATHYLNLSNKFATVVIV
jgi:transcriptional regulator with AAA-type ATPase domain